MCDIKSYANEKWMAMQEEPSLFHFCHVIPWVFYLCADRENKIECLTVRLAPKRGFEIDTFSAIFTEDLILSYVNVLHV
jgi:hypothetical protein